MLHGHGREITTPVATTNYDIDRDGSSGQQSAKITNTDLVAAKFEIEKAKTRVSRNIVISHRIVPARVVNSGRPTAIQEVLQISGIGGFTTPGHYRLVISVGSQPPCHYKTCRSVECE